MSDAECAVAYLLDYHNIDNSALDELIARSFDFIGWKSRKARRGGPYDFEFFLNEAEHDNGQKEIYGQAVNFSGEDVITLICARRETARY